MGLCDPVEGWSHADRTELRKGSLPALVPLTGGHLPSIVKTVWSLGFKLGKGALAMTLFKFTDQTT